MTMAGTRHVDMAVHPASTYSVLLFNEIVFSFLFKSLFCLLAGMLDVL
jgi:hypothetical protein